MYVRTGTDSSPSSFGKISYRLNSDLSTLEDTISANTLASGVDIPAAGTGMTTPSDGYIEIYNATGQNGTISVNHTFAIGGQLGYSALFIRKGMYIATGGTFTRAKFYALS